MHPALGLVLVHDLVQEDALGQDHEIAEDLALNPDQDPDQEIADALLARDEETQDPGLNQDRQSKFKCLFNNLSHLISYYIMDRYYILYHIDVTYLTL